MKPPAMSPGSTAALLAVIVFGLAAVDRFLARVESAEVHSTARRSWTTGSRLLRDGRALEAIDYLLEAHSLERQNPDYEIDLVMAFNAAGKNSEAGPLIADMLQREPNDGLVNLVAARSLRSQNIAEAEAHYHRAVYGTWSTNTIKNRISARMELIDLLAARNQKQALLAELISLDAEATPADIEVRRRVADLFLVAGAPGRAADVYAALVRIKPDDIPAYEGLGEAELEQGQYRAAHETLRRANLRDPNNISVRGRLEILNTVTELDPTQRQLTSAEKYRRSLRILEKTRASLDECKPTNSSKTADQNTDEDQQLLQTADSVINRKAPAYVTNEIAENVLALAQRMWRIRTARCNGTPAGSFAADTSSDRTALDLIMRKLAS